jgi:ADP-ribose pyrophosphatase
MDYDFQVVDKSIVYSGFFRMEKYRLRHRLFSGEWSAEMQRECMERGHAVAVLPYDPIHDRVVLLEQFRIGAIEHSGGPWLLEIVAGIIGPQETKAEVARREAKEEANCELLDMIPILETLVSPGGTSESVALYCGRIDSAGLGGVHGLAEEHEDIRVHVLPRSEAVTLLQSGRIKSAPTIIALQWLELNRQTLLDRWKDRAA